MGRDKNGSPTDGGKFDSALLPNYNRNREGEFWFCAWSKRKMEINTRPLPSSFRDPSGFLFTLDGVLYRQVNPIYQSEYDLLMQSGLYERLVKSRKLIAHEEVDLPGTESPAGAPAAYRILRPERVAFISYPYEWSFSQLKDAALLTLSLQKSALEAGLSLKDASAYNIQFHHGRPILIDTLSFEAYPEGQPWVAYRQFCQHFLAPLALMAYRDTRLSQLLRVYIDGVPLDLASRLLPFRSRLNFGILAHIHLHAAAQKQYAGTEKPVPATSRTMNKSALVGLVDSLESTVRGLQWQPQGTEWGDYYDATNYTREAFDAKRDIVQGFLARVQPGQVWDFGANTGVFSRLAAEQGALTVSSDIDSAAVEKNYRQVRQNKETNLLPLVLDLTNPSPGIGWGNAEREAFLRRGPVDLVMALALVHHLAISNNVPLPALAAFFAKLGRWLVIEFVPKEDSQVQRLLANRKDIFADYHVQGLEAAFAPYFDLREAAPIPGSLRRLYLMERRGAL